MGVIMEPQKRAGIVQGLCLNYLLKYGTFILDFGNSFHGKLQSKLSCQNLSFYTPKISLQS